MEANKNIQKRTFDIIKRTDEKTFNKIEADKFIKILESNNKRISAFNIFSLYANYNESSNFATKNNSPEKFYFNFWHKSLNKKKDE